MDIKVNLVRLLSPSDNPDDTEMGTDYEGHEMEGEIKEILQSIMIKLYQELEESTQKRIALSYLVT